MKARVTVTLKSGVLDPQGLAISGSLKSLGFEGINAVRQGKVFDIDMAEADPVTARAFLTSMCERLLSNTVIENYAIEVMGSAPITTVWPSTQAAAPPPQPTPPSPEVAAAPVDTAPEPETVEPAPAEAQPDPVDPDPVEMEFAEANATEPALDTGTGDATDAGVAAGDAADLDPGAEPDAAKEERPAPVWEAVHEGVAFDIAEAIAGVASTEIGTPAAEPEIPTGDSEGETEKPQHDANDLRDTTRPLGS
jgi:phosphoribosylformylglycinamidine synthase